MSCKSTANKILSKIHSAPPAIFFNLYDSETCHLDISDDLYDDIKDIFYSLYFHSSDLDFSNLTEMSGLLIRNDHIVLDGSLIDEETKIKILSGNLLQVDRLLVSQVKSQGK